MLQGHSLPYDIERVRLWRCCLIKYAHKRPFTDPAGLGIPGLIFQVEVIKLGTVKPVYNDHLYDKIYPLWFIQ